MRLLLSGIVIFSALLLCQCGTVGTGNMGGPTAEERTASIASEPSGDFFYGRRYYVEKTRFWGYVRRPRQSWDKAKLVMINESKKKQPDRLPENGPDGARYGYDQNYEYRLNGYFTGRNAYDPNSDQQLPEFMLTGYEAVNKNPGWLFRPDDRYNPIKITIYPR
ncbi:MAG: hypothetical protein JWO82_2592 [Akkermansiaceae bacterium]|nr:hypothetical protein [Akkermansiaceae bacterium]